MHQGDGVSDSGMLIIAVQISSDNSSDISPCDTSAKPAMLHRWHLGMKHLHMEQEDMFSRESPCHFLGALLQTLH